MTELPDRLRTAFIIVTCACVLFSLLLAPLCSASTEPDARSAIAVAEQQVDACYVAASEADKAGANVTGLLSTLNDAGDSLSRAQLALVQGNFDSAYSLALESEGKLNGFEAVASGLKNSAVNAGNLDLAVNVVGSSVGAVLVVVLGFVVWRLLRKKYPGAP